MKRTAIIGFILLCCVGCDQASKTVARQILPKFEAIILLNDMVRFQCTENPGGFLGLGKSIPERPRFLLFTLLVGICLSVMLIYLILTKHLSKYQTIALSLVLGGGFGNLIDRLFNDGQVVDFINLGIGSLRTGIFNVADIAITFGVIWLFLASIKISPQQS